MRSPQPPEPDQEATSATWSPTAGKADALWHGRAKLTRAERGADAEAGYWASVYLVGAIVEILYAIADRPLPPGSRRFELVGTLDLPEQQLTLFEQLCAGPSRPESDRRGGPTGGRARAATRPANQRPRTRPAKGRGGLAT